MLYSNKDCVNFSLSINCSPELVQGVSIYKDFLGSSKILCTSNSLPITSSKNKSVTYYNTSVSINVTKYCVFDVEK